MSTADVSKHRTGSVNVVPYAHTTVWWDSCKAVFNLWSS